MTISFTNSVSVKESILENIKTTLENITVANGYHNNVQRVLRFKIAGWQTVVFPTLMVVGIDTTKKPIEGYPPRMDAVLRGAVMSVLTNDPVEDTEQLHNLLMLDIEAALQVDVQRGGYARETTVIGEDLEVHEAEVPFCVSTVAFEVRFTHGRQDPTIAR